METLDVLEWPRVWRAVASFAATWLAKEELRVLDIPATRETSEASERLRRAHLFTRRPLRAGSLAHTSGTGILSNPNTV